MTSHTIGETHRLTDEQRAAALEKAAAARRARDGGPVQRAQVDVDRLPFCR